MSSMPAIRWPGHSTAQPAAKHRPGPTAGIGAERATLGLHPPRFAPAPVTPTRLGHPAFSPTARRHSMSDPRVAQCAPSRQPVSRTRTGRLRPTRRPAHPTSWWAAADRISTVCDLFGQPLGVLAHGKFGVERTGSSTVMTPAGLSAAGRAFARCRPAPPPSPRRTP